jgi:hypothetical protein
MSRYLAGCKHRGGGASFRSGPSAPTSEAYASSSTRSGASIGPSSAAAAAVAASGDEEDAELWTVTNVRAALRTGLTRHRADPVSERRRWQPWCDTGLLTPRDLAEKIKHPWLFSVSFITAVTRSYGDFS